MPSAAKSAFEANREDVDRLWAIHQDVAGGGPGRKRDVEVLNRAAVVFITACWESYVEDVAKEAFDHMVDHAPSASAVPSKIKSFVAQRLRDEQNPLEEWALADSGWQTQLKAHQSEVEKRWTGSFNTPKSEQVKGLFSEMLGITNVTTDWRWKKMKASTARDKLDEYVTLRGDIAHRVTSTTPVYKADGSDYLNHVVRLSDKTDDTVRKHIEKVVGTPPW